MIPLTIEVINDIKIEIVQTTDLTVEEQETIQKFFSNPVIIKYLKLLSYNQMSDFANIQLPLNTDGLFEYAAKQAYVKGGLGLLKTLLSMHISQSTKK